VRVAFAGIGSAAMRGHFPALSRVDGFEVVAAADPDPTRRRAASALFPVIPVFHSADAMLEGVGCDALVVAAPPSEHGELVAIGVEHGVDVVCEKPFVLSRAEHEWLAQSMARSPSVVIPVHQYRYASGWTIVGGAATALARRHQEFALTAVVRRPGPDVSAVTSWRGHRWTSGGVLADHGVHFLALAWDIDADVTVVDAGPMSATGAPMSYRVVLQCGGGVVTIELDPAAQQRSTSVGLAAAQGTLTWSDSGVEFRASGRQLMRLDIPGLAARSYVDSLYEQFYARVASRRCDPAWRRERNVETLRISELLLEASRRSSVELTAA
jgi:predicted dehydrogenase